MRWKVKAGAVGLGQVVNGTSLSPIVCSCDKIFDQTELVADYINMLNDLLIKPNTVPTGVKGVIARGIPQGKAYIAFQRGGYIAYYNAADISVV
jgi:hypothetical protein